MTTATRVVNLRHADFDVYIGRAGRGYDGTFGNPYSVRRYGERALELYRQYFAVRIAHDVDFRVKVEALRGKTLGCFCKKPDGTGRCHGDVIVEWLEQNKNGGTQDGRT